MADVSIARAEGAEGKEEEENCSEDFFELVLWAKENGVEMTKCKPSLVGERERGWRGIVATDTIEPNSACVRVPLRCAMTATACSLTEDDARVNARLSKLGLNSVDRLVIQLLREKRRGKDSPYWKYIKQLPDSYACLHHWEGDAAQLLQDEDFVAHHERVRKQILRDFRSLPCLHKPKKKRRRFLSQEGEEQKEEEEEEESSDSFVTLEEYLWARSTVLSRSVYLPQCGNEAGGLCPIGDLFNYYPPSGPQPLLPQPFLDHMMRMRCEREREEEVEATHKSSSPFKMEREREMKAQQEQESDSDESYQNQFQLEDQEEFEFEGISGDGNFEQSSNTFVFKTGDRTYHKGEQIHLCYGQYSNRSLIEIYGFLLWDNPQESVCLSISDDGQRIPGELRPMASGRGGSGSAYEVYQNGYPSWDLLCFIRWKAVAAALNAASNETRPSLGQNVNDVSIGSESTKNGESWSSRIQQGRIVSLDLEIKAFDYLHFLCVQKLKQYATTPEEDRLILAGLEKKEMESERGEKEKQLEHEKLAVQWRLCQKRVLEKAKEICKIYQEHLRNHPTLYQGF